jgi:hypothetical protein
MRHLHPTIWSEDMNSQMLRRPYFRYLEIQQHATNKIAQLESVKKILATCEADRLRLLIEARIRAQTLVASLPTFPHYRTFGHYKKSQGT